MERDGEWIITRRPMVLFNMIQISVACLRLVNDPAEENVAELPEFADLHSVLRCLLVCSVQGLPKPA